VKLVEHGWLAKDPAHSGLVEGVFIGAEWSTRREEYSLARKWAVGDTCLDVGTGFNPAIHLFAYIMARAGWAVDATDPSPGILNLPPHPRVTYHHTEQLDFLDASIDYVTCISTLEHLRVDKRVAVVTEMQRIARCRIVATADCFGALPKVFGFDVEPGPPPFAHLDPPVYYVVMDA